MEYVQQRNIEKVSRFLEKGLDPNFHDPDSGGEDVCAMGNDVGVIHEDLGMLRCKT